MGKKNAFILPRLRPKSHNQQAYLSAIQQHPITFCKGFAGSGKTFIALHCALDALYSGEVEKILIVRPLIAANFGEDIGYLPGDINEKTRPYTEGIVDNLELLLPTSEINRLINQKQLNFCALSLLRGRSLNKHFILVDEAQNAANRAGGLLHVLTRIGEDSKLVIAGDLHQNDLREDTDSAFEDAVNKLENLDEVAIVELYDKVDIVRNPLVAKILSCYGF